MNDAAVKLTNVCKDIGSKEIIKDVSFEVYKGEVFGFLGPNGAGKTTTIRMMVGLMSITSGDIHIDGASIKTDYEQAVRQVGAIVENPEMYKFLTGYQNLKQYARMMPGITPERLDEVIELVGLTGRIKEKVKTYSLGMRQRLGIAQALLHKPKVLILDEPTNGLDPAGIREIRDYLRSLAREEGMAIVVSSHLLSEMELMCDRVGIIQKGELIDIQSIRDFINDGGKTLYQLECEPVEEAMSLMREMEMPHNLAEGKLQAEMDRTAVPMFIKSLVDREIAVFEVKEVTKTLEDKFLEKTSQERGV
ncbi:ABC transporter ATP-binding protein [Sutcliffiella horikoshii]|uniref:ABC transporter ATP-binding protein n=1 Tax=Sutcliffiella horikoshii TaxID=79883 RepID=A0A5D4T8C2_9BACI|nr:ABC transporter ATP-binding protein [Sutcliffiella horikoshii]TYS70938.1 ABC transporter ATP-binding protein [Sutcliffiella horikoshii]